MRVSEASSAEAGVVGSMRDGVLEQKFLLTGKEGTLHNYVLNVGRTGAGGWTTPRHRHNFDQIRYVMKGIYPYAKGKSMSEGTVAYFPESVHYGPQDRPEGLEMMVCQFGGASGSGFVSIAQQFSRRFSHWSSPNVIKTVRQIGWHDERHTSVRPNTSILLDNRSS